MDPILLIAVLSGIVLLLVLILWVKLQAFLSLLIASIATGLIAGMPPESLILAIQDGMGSTLGYIAMVVGLGTLLGGMLEFCGGIQVLADKLLAHPNKDKSPWALLFTGFIVSIPVFFDVGLVLLIPVAYALQKKTGKSLLIYALPLLAGLAITHAFIPPTPGPVAVAEILNADLGWVIVAGLVSGLVAALVAGPFFAKKIAKRIFIKSPDEQLDQELVQESTQLPKLSMVLMVIFSPLALILLHTLVQSGMLSLNAQLLSFFLFIGHPFMALIIANLLAWYFMGLRLGYKKDTLLNISMRSLQPAGLIILVTGAGGVFKEVLTRTGAGEQLAQIMIGYHIHPLLIAFLAASLIRLLQGSSTVAMITAAGLLASLISEMEFHPFQLALMVIAIASGATTVSHVNDSGFWLVNRYLYLTEADTLKSWTLMTGLIGLSGLVSAWLMWSFV